MPIRLATRDPGFEPGFQRLLETKRESAADVDAAVAAIIDDVALRGDAALIDYTSRFDGVDLSVSGLRLAGREIAEGAAMAPPETVAALRLAAERIESFHRRQLPPAIDYVDAVGVRLANRWRPISAAGLYVPGGTAAYPSSLLMNAIPAKVAGVARLVMTVPAPGGVLNPLVLAAAELVGIDMIAGPSEILVVADRGNDPGWIAADLLSQAEHDSAAQAILVTDDPAFAAEVEAAIERHLARLPRAQIARASWQTHGAILLVTDWEEAAALIDRIAPEHLELALDDADALAQRVRHAGAIFLGRHTPEAIGDYIAGPNHVLPTARSARFASGLGVLDFLKRSSLVRCDAASLAVLAPAAIHLAEAEGLEAHALSLAIRLPRKV